MSSSKDELTAQIQNNLAKLASLKIKKSKQMQGIQHLEGLNEVSEVLLLQQREETQKEIDATKDEIKTLEHALAGLDEIKKEIAPEVLIYNPKKNTILKPLFNKEQQKIIVSQMSEILSGLFSFVELESMKLNRLDNIVSQALTTLSLNAEIMNALLNETNKKALLNMILYAYYILTSVSQKTSNNYAEVFKDNLAILQNAMSESNIRDLLNVLSTTQNCLRILPLAYQEIVSH